MSWRGAGLRELLREQLDLSLSASALSRSTSALSRSRSKLSLKVLSATAVSSRRPSKRPSSLWRLHA